MSASGNEAEALVDAAERGAIEEVRRLLSAGVEVDARAADGRTALLAALGEGGVETAALLLERGAVAAVDAHGLGPLHHAVGSGQRSVILLGLDLASGPDPRDKVGMTPMTWAVLLDDRVAIDLLLDAGANPDEADNDGWTPLHHAAAKGNTFAIKRLLARGAHALKRLPSGHSAKDLARYYATDPEACIVLEAAEALLEIT